MWFSQEDPLKFGENLVREALMYGYEGNIEKLGAARDSVLSDIDEVLRNCVDHDEPEKAEFYEKVKKVVKNY